MTSVSIVVAAEAHNPSILHPSFLTAEGIVPEDWEIADGPICTPPFAQTGYSNGIVFRVDAQRLQIVDNNPKNHGTDSPVPTLTAAYVQKLPHVRYSAVGVNFTGIAELVDSDRYLIERFLKKGMWNGETLAPLSAGIQLAYEIPGARFNLSLKPGRIAGIDGREDRLGVILDGNCHSDTTDLSQVLAAVARFQASLQQSNKICTQVLYGDV